MKTCWKVNPPGSLGEGTEYYFSTRDDAVKAAIPEINEFMNELDLDMDDAVAIAIWTGLVSETEIPVTFFFSEEHGEVTFSEADLVAVE